MNIKSPPKLNIKVRNQAPDTDPRSARRRCGPRFSRAFGIRGFAGRSFSALRAAASLWPALLLLGTWTSALAELPLPAFIYFGEVRNAYGAPYVQADEVQVIVRVDGRECGRKAVDERLGPGMNYRVEVPLDDGQGARYASFAARQGNRDPRRR